MDKTDEGRSRKTINQYEQRKKVQTYGTEARDPGVAVIKQNPGHQYPSNTVFRLRRA